MKLPAVVVNRAAAPLALSYTARTRGEREVEVRARVSGVLLRKQYTEGQHVRAGDRLFLIDPAPLAAELRAAEGRAQMAEARLHSAEQQVRRSALMMDAGVISRRSHEEAEAEHDSAGAALSAARAELAQARLNRGYAEVTAPFSGVTGREARAEGSMVRADDESALLTTLVQDERLFVEFTVPEVEAQLLRAALQRNPAGVTARLRTGQGEVLPKLARITFVGPRVAADTGTVDVRAIFDNSPAVLSPGQFVRVDITGIATPETIHLPMRAIVHGADGPYVWKLDAKGLAAMQPVTLGAVNGEAVAVERGLVPGDRVIVEGMLKLQPKTPVQPILAPAAGETARQ